MSRMQRMGRRNAWLLALALPAIASAQPMQPMPASGDWRFEVLLDGQPIGTHRFSLSTEDGVATLRSEARLDVRLLGITVYRYRHEATERWRGGCLVGLQSNTDDDGQALRVQAVQAGETLSVTATGQAPHSLTGCVMTYAYWLPAMRQQARLLNAQTGRYEAVTFAPLDDARLPVHGEDTAARRWRLTGPEQPIELWYSPQGDWLGLDARVSRGKRLLSYRLS